MASMVNFTSALVSGDPSDHFMPALSLIVTSIWVSSIFFTMPLAVVGTSVTRSGIGLFWPSKTQSEAQIGPVTTCCVVAALLERTFKSCTGSQSEKTRVPPCVPLAGLYCVSVSELLDVVLLLPHAASSTLMIAPMAVAAAGRHARLVFSIVASCCPNAVVPPRYGQQAAFINGSVSYDDWKIIRTSTRSHKKFPPLPPFPPPAWRGRVGWGPLGCAL